MHVAAPSLTAITVTPNPVPTIAPGATAQLTVTGSYDFGPTRDLTSTASYSASPSGLVTFSSGGLVTAVSAGTATITAAVTPTGAATISGTTSVTVTAPQTGYDPGAGWSLVWSDEFNGTAVDQTNWTFDIGSGGWGNNESEYYRAENALVAGGMLTITAKREPFGDAQYTSARLQTSRKRAFTYGKFTMRAKLPYSQAMWPAFWMLGANSNSFNLYGGNVTWPGCGEADIMEMIGGLADGSGDFTTHGTLHYLNSVGRNPAPSYSFRAPSRLADDFHVYELIWTPHSFTWKFDGLAIGTKLIDADMEEFSKPMFLLLNLAVGGAWGGWVDGSTVFPQNYVIDYVRVYTNDSCLPGGTADLASYWHLSNVAASGVSPVAESLSSSPGTVGGFQPVKTLTAPAVWYGPALTGSFEEGAWSIGIFTSSPGASARVKAELFVTAADGSGASSLGAAELDMNATGGGNHRSWFTLTGVPAVHLSGQRMKLVLTPVSGASVTMIYNGTDFDSLITAPFSPR
jgi:beta-glucanase (GH16 family)